MNETLEALMAATSVMWPAPAEVEFASGRERRFRSGGRLVREFLVLPSARSPRLVVPAETSGAGREALRRSSQDLTTARRLARAVLSVGFPVVRRTFPDRLRVTTPADTRRDSVDALDTHLSELLGHEVLVSFGVGSPRANRKPVLQVHRADGETVGFAKLGTTPVTRELVRGEAAALAAYWSVDPPAVRLEVPRVLHAGTWRDVELLLLSPLRPRSRRPERRTDVPVDAMHELATRWGTTRRALAETPFWKAIREIPALEPVASAVEARYGHTVLPFGAWHGDWTPWNMSWDGDRVLLWDFERFATGVPLGLDAAHHRFQTALRRHGESGAAALVTGAADDDPTTLVYLCELGRRWVLASTPPEGEPLRRRTAWLLSLLADVRQRVLGRADP
ncbi:MAG TPA: hypothetical protein VI076_14660 [Actinopolymorphaceae bacterium]